MARRKSSGFLETLLKSAFGVGTTVHYRTDWLGRRQKVVKHHDTGKTKTYTHSDGFLFGGTTTRTSQNGRSIESADELTVAVRTTKIGERVPFTYWRDGRTFNGSITTASD